MQIKLYCLFRSLSGTLWSYDAVTNRLIRLKGVPESADTEWVDAFLLRKGLVGVPAENKEACYRTDREEYLRLLDGYAGRLTLEVTESCNLRCSYCIYSGRFPGARSHSSRHMTLDTARAAIDMFAGMSRFRKRKTVCFYGGEALLRFDAIRELVPYARKAVDGELYFHIGSNGTLADDAFFDWLNDNRDVYLDITLNGAEHDRRRRYIDGRPTQSDILDNYFGSKARYPETAAERVNFICNAADNREISQLHSFYSSLGLTPALITGIEFPEDPEEAVGMKPADAASAASEDASAEYELKRGYLRGGDAFLESLYDPSMLRIHYRGESIPAGKTVLAGACLPLLTNIFVNTDGELSLCERVRLSPVGDVCGGPDIEGITELMSGFLSALKDRCRSCWAQRLCTVCFKDYDERSKTVPPRVCSEMRRQIMSELSLYASVREEAPDLLERYQKAESVPDEFNNRL